MDIMEVLRRHRIVAIIRGIEEEKAGRVLKALMDGGIKMIEVTMNTDGVLRMIDRFRSETAGACRIGAGTVTDLKAAKEALAAGAEYLISPNLDEEVVDYARSQGVEIWPGVMTPTEIVKAWKAGAKAVKLFPMASLGLGYLKEVRAPLNHIPIIATGGVSLMNIRDFLEAGAFGCGIGGSLVDKGLIREGDYEAMERLAKQYVQAVDEFNGSN